jgi:hypothetical protein
MEVRDRDEAARKFRWFWMGAVMLGAIGLILAALIYAAGWIVAWM